MSDEHNPNSNVYTVVIGGAAGDGIREAGHHITFLLHTLGFETYFAFEYPSLIRGGHNEARISFSKEKVYCSHKAIDVLIAVNAESVRLHRDELKEGAVVIVESAYFDDVKDLGLNVIALPMKAAAEEIKAPLVARSSSAFGVFCYLAGLSLEKTRDLSSVIFADIGAETNVALVEKGYNYVQEQNISRVPWAGDTLTIYTPVQGELVDANKAVAQGFLSAGLQYYIAYPMTPSTSVLHFLAKVKKEHNLKVIHPEDEISVINMAFGVSYAGKRVAIGTATGGFALMQEAFSFGGVTELPLAIVLSQRKGPATGVATHTGQGDLRFVLHAGHGEFPRIVVAPGDPDEAYHAGVHVLNLAWKYQVSAIVLLDKNLSENTTTATYDPNNKAVEPGALRDTIPEGEVYKRYALTENGVSPMAFPGMQNAVVKVTSYEHEEDGISTEEGDMVRMMHDKRARKLRNVLNEFFGLETVKVFGDSASEIALVFWGSTKGPVLEAMKYIHKPIRAVQIIAMEPFDTERVRTALAGVTRVIDVELNGDAQLAGLIREKTGIAVTDTVLRYDSLSFEPLELAEKINSLIA